MPQTNEDAIAIVSAKNTNATEQSFKKIIQNLKLLQKPLANEETAIIYFNQKLIRWANWNNQKVIKRIIQ